MFTTARFFLVYSVNKPAKQSQRQNSFAICGNAANAHLLSFDSWRWREREGQRGRERERGHRNPL